MSACANVMIGGALQGALIWPGRGLRATASPRFLDDIPGARAHRTGVAEPGIDAGDVGLLLHLRQPRAVRVEKIDDALERSAATSPRTRSWTYVVRLAQRNCRRGRNAGPVSAERIGAPCRRDAPASNVVDRVVMFIFGAHLNEWHRRRSMTS